MAKTKQGKPSFIMPVGTFILGYEEKADGRKIPIIAVLRSKTDTLFFFCEHCGRDHVHGGCGGFGKGDGHRSAHCKKPNSPYDRLGYILKELSVEEWENLTTK